MAFSAKDQNKDFAWNVEQNYTLAPIKHMASILFQFLKSSAKLYYIFLGLCSFVLCANEKEYWENGIGRPMQNLLGFFSRVGTLRVPVCSFPLGHSSAPGWADVFVSITQVYLFG